MLQIDFTKRKEPYRFIKKLMSGYSEKEIQQAHERYCEYLNVLVRIYNQKVGKGDSPDFE
jgi:hypothetical protein